MKLTKKQYDILEDLYNGCGITHYAGSDTAYLISFWKPKEIFRVTPQFRKLKELKLIEHEGFWRISHEGIKCYLALKDKGQF